MKVTHNASLRSLNSFGLEASATLLIEIESEEDVLALPVFNPSRDVLLGGGSNVVFVSDIPGTAYLNRISGIDIVAETDQEVLVEAGAGENWHDLVRWSVDRGLCGLENLSLIPGSVGAAPVQNIGAYGVELASAIRTVTAWDWKTASWVSLDPVECRFGYRDSLFKSAEPDRFLITSVRLALQRTFRPRLDYAGLRDELGDCSRAAPTPRDVSDAVIRLRRRKLPDPARQGNAGSFFKNPTLDSASAAAIQEKWPDLPAWPRASGSVRISAAWLIEQCGLKGAREGGAAVSDQHALVLVNRGNASGREVATLAARVVSAVRQRYGVTLEPEPRLFDFS